jgi:hypothetical protein
MIKYIFVKEFYKKLNKNYVYTFYYHHLQCCYQRLQMLLVLSATIRDLGLQLLSGHFADTFDELQLDFAFIIKYIVDFLNLFLFIIKLFNIFFLE